MDWDRLPLEEQRKLNSRHERSYVERLLIEGDGRNWFKRNRPAPRHRSIKDASPEDQRALFIALGGDPKTWDAEQRERRR